MKKKIPGCSSVRAEYSAWNRGVVGSNPTTPIKGCLGEIITDNIRRHSFVEENKESILTWIITEDIKEKVFRIGTITSFSNLFKNIIIVVYGNRFGIMILRNRFGGGIVSSKCVTSKLCEITYGELTDETTITIPLDFTYEKDKLIEAINEAVIIQNIVDAL